MNNTVKLEVTEDYEIDTTGNAYIETASKIKNLYVLKISYSPSEKIGYTLTLKLPKWSELEKSLVKRLFYDFEIMKSLLPEKETTDSGNPVIKWRVPEG